MIIDCDICTVRGAACADCVVTFLAPPGAVGTSAVATGSRGAGTARASVRLAPPAAPRRAIELVAAETAALDALAAAGLVPPLRHAATAEPRTPSRRAGARSVALRQAGTG